MAGERRLDRVSAYYDDYWSGEVPPHYELSETLSGLVVDHVDPASRCLDVGCGTGGSYGRWVNEHAASYLGVDVSAQAVKLARASGLDAQVIDDAGTLPFPDESFDLAICFEVFEHLFEPDRAAGEILRVLRPGGRLIASAPNAMYWRLRLNILFGIWNPLGDENSLERPWRDPHIRFFSTATLERMLRESGFSAVAVGAHGGLFLDHLTSRPTSFGAGRVYRRLERSFPSLLGLTIHAVGTK